MSGNNLISETFDPNKHQHVRYNPLKDEWILVSPHRALRPWSGQTENQAIVENLPEFDPTNPLCPGVQRSSGIQTPEYKSTHVFTNDFPALMEDGPECPPSNNPLFQCKTAKGTCRVMCFHPKMNVYISSMTLEEIISIIDEWLKQMKELGTKYAWVQIFENRGSIMGCSNPHPHCQIWASNFLPNEASAKDKNMLSYYQKYKRPLLKDYLQEELIKKERIVLETSEWVVLVPYWAVWPFETMMLPKKQIERFTDCSAEQKADLANAMKKLVTIYDGLFNCSFPYSMGWHGAPTGHLSARDQSHWTFHGLYLPPLLRSATIKKFMVGYELLAQNQRDLSPEKAAHLLREQADATTN